MVIVSLEAEPVFVKITKIVLREGRKYFLTKTICAESYNPAGNGFIVRETCNEKVICPEGFLYHWIALEYDLDHEKCVIPLCLHYSSYISSI